jgi:hypothetical protein
MGMSPDALRRITNNKGLITLDMLLWNGKTYEKDGFADFIAMSPPWLRSRNEHTGPYPFQLAASLPNPDLSLNYIASRLKPCHSPTCRDLLASLR